MRLRPRFASSRETGADEVKVVTETASGEVVEVNVEAEDVEVSLPAPDTQQRPPQRSRQRREQIPDSVLAPAKTRTEESSKSPHSPPPRSRKVQPVEEDDRKGRMVGETRSILPGIPAKITGGAVERPERKGVVPHPQA